MKHGVDFDELVTRISVEAERLAEAGEGPTALVDAVMREGAADLASLAAERHHHAVVLRLEDEHRLMLAERSPLFRVDERALIAAPVGPMGRDGLARFCDRVLAEVATGRPSRVLLVRQGFDAHDGAAVQIDALEGELAALGVALERR